MDGTFIGTTHFIGIAAYHGAMLFTLFFVSIYFFKSKKL